MSPPPDTIIVPLLVVLAVLASTVKVILPLFAPLAILLRNQAALLVTVQETLLATLMGCVLTTLLGDHVDGVTLS